MKLLLSILIYVEKQKKALSHDNASSYFNTLNVING